MKDYGLIVVDNAANFFVSGASDSMDVNNQITLTWNNDDIQDEFRGLKNLKFSDFEAVDLTPRVTGFSTNRAMPGATITIFGKNFSGAAGSLAVYFGAVRASTVTYVDDRHIRVVIPRGVTGTVHVRVQAGRSSAIAATENVKGTVFGYGISSLTAADLFTVLFGRRF